MEKSVGDARNLESFCFIHAGSHKTSLELLNLAPTTTFHTNKLMGRSHFKILREGLKSLESSQGKELVLKEKEHLLPHDVQQVSSLIKQSASTLQSLQLVDCNLAVSDIVRLKTALVPAVKRSSSFVPADVVAGDADAADNRVLMLQSLNLNRNKIGQNEGAEVIGEIVRFHPLQNLKLVKNDLRAQGFSEICNALTWNPRYLHVLDVTNNQICARGARRMGQILLKPKLALKTLNMAFNEIGDVGMMWLSLSLTKNKSLETLNLAHNGLTDGCVEVLISALVKNRAVTSLNLSYNQFTGDGLQKLLVGIESLNVNLLQLQIKTHSPMNNALNLLASSICQRNQRLLERLASSIPIGRKLVAIFGGHDRMDQHLLPPELLLYILRFCTFPTLTANEHHHLSSLLLDRKSVGSLAPKNQDQDFSITSILNLNPV